MATSLDLSWSDNLSAISAINSEFTVFCQNGTDPVVVGRGETVMIPAAVGSYRIEVSDTDDECVIVKTTI